MGVFGVRGGRGGVSENDKENHGKRRIFFPDEPLNPGKEGKDSQINKVVLTHEKTRNSKEARKRRSGLEMGAIAR